MNETNTTLGDAVTNGVAESGETVGTAEVTGEKPKRASRKGKSAETVGNAETVKAEENGTDGKSLTLDEVKGLFSSMFEEYAKRSDTERQEAEKLANMNAQEKAEYERDGFKQQLEELQRKVALAEMQAQARQMLRDSGVTVGDSVIAAITTDNAETTKKNVEEFAQAFQSAVENAVKERLKGGTPKRAVGGNGLTKEQIRAIDDPVKRQRAIAENLGLYVN